MKQYNLSMTTTMFALVLILLAIGGWVANIFKLIGMIGDTQITTMFIGRIVGIFVGPLGSVLGFM